LPFGLGGPGGRTRASTKFRERPIDGYTFLIDLEQPLSGTHHGPLAHIQLLCHEHSFV